MRKSIVFGIVACLALLFLVQETLASTTHASNHPIRRPSTPFLAMKKAAAERMRRHSQEVITCYNDDDEGNRSPRTGLNGSSKNLFSGNIKGVIRASYVLNESMSGDMDPELHPTYYEAFFTKTVEQDWFAKKSAVVGLGSGTHMDSSCHVYEQPCLSIADFNVTQYTMNPLVVINITNKVFGNPRNPDYELSVADLQAWESTHRRRIPPRAFVAMMSGWSNRVYNEVLYYNRDATGQKHFPGFSNDAIDWLLTNRPSISGIGVDTSSVDGGINWSFHTHYAINGVAKISVENLKLSDPNIPLVGAYISNVPILHADAPEAPVASTIYV